MKRLGNALITALTRDEFTVRKPHVEADASRAGQLLPHPAYCISDVREQRTHRNRGTHLV